MDNKIFGVIDARCNHEDGSALFTVIVHEFKSITDDVESIALRVLIFIVMDVYIPLSLNV